MKPRPVNVLNPEEVADPDDTQLKADNHER
jgi:hypothetical protein